MFERLNFKRLAPVLEVEVRDQNIVGVMAKTEKRRVMSFFELMMFGMIGYPKYSVCLTASTGEKMANFYRFLKFVHDKRRTDFEPFTNRQGDFYSSTIQFDTVEEFNSFMRGLSNNFRHFVVYIDDMFYCVGNDFQIMSSRCSVTWMSGSYQEVLPSETAQQQ